MANHICSTCGKTFPNGRAFERHPCVTKLASLSMEELMALLPQPKAKPATTKTEC
jgi:hypothetical protein